MIADEDFPEEGSYDAEDVENTFEDAVDTNTEIQNEDTTQEQAEETFSINELPDSFEKINKIATILKDYP
jgi:hypothetical protein